MNGNHAPKQTTALVPIWTDSTPFFTPTSVYSVAGPPLHTKLHTLPPGPALLPLQTGAVLPTAEIKRGQGSHGQSWTLGRAVLLFLHNSISTQVFKPPDRRLIMNTEDKDKKQTIKMRPEEVSNKYFLEVIFAALLKILTQWVWGWKTNLFYSWDNHVCHYCAGYSLQECFGGCFCFILFC